MVLSLSLSLLLKAFVFRAVRTVFLIGDCDQRLLLLSDGGSIGRLALGSSQDEAELLVLFVDGVVHENNHARLLAFPWREAVNLLSCMQRDTEEHVERGRGLTWQEGDG